MNDLDRTKYMGSGDAAAACGVSRFNTPLDVYLAKRGEPSDIDNFPIRFGTWNEPLVIAEFERQSGLKVADRQKHMRHSDYRHYLSSRWQSRCSGSQDNITAIR